MVKVRSLQETCEEQISYFLEDDSFLYISKFVFLPELVAESILHVALQKKILSDRHLYFFSNCQRCRLLRLNFPNSEFITNFGLQQLLQHNITEVNLSNCKNIQGTIAQQLSSLTSLKSLSLSSIKFTEIDASCLKQLTTLTKLDISSTDLLAEPVDVFSVTALVNLRSLNVSDTALCDENLAAIGGSSLATTLRDLNVSKTFISSDSMKNLIRFRNLTSLDLSRNIFDDVDEFAQLAQLKNLEKLSLCSTSIYSVKLNPLLTLPKLKFLGLCQTTVSYIDLSFRESTEDLQYPELIVANHHSLIESKNVLKYYSDDLTYCLLAVKAIFSSLSERIISKSMGLLSLLLDTIENFPDSFDIQMTASASMYYLMKQEVKDQDPDLRQRALRVLLHLLSEKLDTQATASGASLDMFYQLVKNVCLSLCNYSISPELEREYFLVVTLLLRAALVFKEDLIMRIAVALSNNLLSLGVDEKIRLGENHVILYLLQIIVHKLSEDELDFVMEMAWGSLWNITDETPVNCEIFVNEGGLDLFLHIIEEKGHDDIQSLVRNMLGLLGNIAEVDFLRPKIANEKLIGVLKDFLSHPYEDLELPYNASGIISNIATSLPGHSKQEILNAMYNSISSWDIYASRNINYRSLKPIICLLKSPDYQIQYWASWALANLTTVYPDRYVAMVTKENGVEYLTHVTSGCSNEKVKLMAQRALDSCTAEKVLAS